MLPPERSDHTAVPELLYFVTNRSCVPEVELVSSPLPKFTEALENIPVIYKFPDASTATALPTSAVDPPARFDHTALPFMSCFTIKISVPPAFDKAPVPKFIFGLAKLPVV